MAVGCWEVTTFMGNFGTFDSQVMPFGLTRTPSTFQNARDEVLKGLDIVQVYLDGIVIYSKRLEGHIEHLSIVIDRIKKHKQKIKMQKREFVKTEINVFGDVVCRDGGWAYENKTEKL